MNAYLQSPFETDLKSASQCSCHHRHLNIMLSVCEDS